jgi:DNA-binding NarL/FixJ family response regulator
MLIDDHEVVRLGLRTLIEKNSDMIVIAEAGNAKEALRSIQHSRPEVALLDLRLPDCSGLNLCRDICERFPDLRVIILTSFISDDIVNRAIQSGACGYLLKEVAGEDLIKAIRSVVRGETFLDPQSTSLIVSRLQSLQSKVDMMTLDTLSCRETDIVKLVGQGKSNKQIGAELNLSPITVRNYVSNVLAKLGLSNRIELAIFATKHHLLDE